jgi:hypothetical protein
MRNIGNRIGVFFMIVGIAVLALFFTSDFVQKPNVGYLFWGIVFTFLGVVFMRASRPEREESQRFRLARKLFSRKEKEE